MACNVCPCRFETFVAYLSPISLISCHPSSNCNKGTVVKVQSLKCANTGSKCDKIIASLHSWRPSNLGYRTAVCPTVTRWRTSTRTDTCEDASSVRGPHWRQWVWVFWQTSHSVCIDLNTSNIKCLSALDFAGNWGTFLYKLFPDHLGFKIANFQS